LSKYVLGYWWLCWEPHKEFCGEIQRDRHRRLYLLPRGHCKSRIFSIADTIRHNLLKPSEPIGLGSDTRARAVKRLRGVKYHHESNPVFRSLFADRVWRSPKDRRECPRWGEDEIFLPGYVSTEEASVTAFGIEAMPTGSHFARIKFDDLVVPENTTNSDQMVKLRDSYALVRSSILTTYGNVQICGTIYDDGDLHREMEDSGDYLVYKRPAEWMDLDEDGIKRRKTLWPVQYGPNQLDEIKHDALVSTYIYSCQYLLDPVPEDSSAFFQLAWFPRYERLPRNLRYYAGGDLAISERDSACNTALPVVGLDTNNDLYLVDVPFGHWDSLTIVDKMTDLQARYRMGLFGVEAENIARTIMPFLKVHMQETGIYINVEPMSPMSDKLTKARSLQGRAKQGAIWLPKKGPKAPDWLFDVELQLRRFPRGKDKDIVDGLGVVCRMLDKQVRPWTDAETLATRERDRYQPLDATAGY
jgi:predicted phage terminase large subunit-like protein